MNPLQRALADADRITTANTAIENHDVATLTAIEQPTVIVAHYGTCEAHTDVHAFGDECVGWTDYPTTTHTDDQEV